MTLDDLRNKAATDLKMDTRDLDREAIKTPELYSDWLKIFSQENLTLKRLKLERKEIERDLWLFYNGKHPVKNYDIDLDRGTASKFIESDDKMMNHDKKIELQDEKVNFSKDVLKVIGQRSYLIRDAIEWRKFMHGN